MSILGELHGPAVLKVNRFRQVFPILFCNPRSRTLITFFADTDDHTQFGTITGVLIHRSLCVWLQHPEALQSIQSKSKITMLFDDILDHIGPYGLYQKRVLFLASLVAIPVAMNNVGSVFLAASLDHWCSVYDAGDGGGGIGEAMDYCGGAVDQRNATLCEQLKQNSIPLDEDGKVTILGLYMMNGIF